MGARNEWMATPEALVATTSPRISSGLLLLLLLPPPLPLPLLLLPLPAFRLGFAA